MQINRSAKGVVPIGFSSMLLTFAFGIFVGCSFTQILDYNTQALGPQSLIPESGVQVYPVTSFAATSKAPDLNSTNAESALKFVGTYNGTLMEGDPKLGESRDHVITIIEIGKENTLAGSYSVLDSNKHPFTGQLEQVGPISEHSATFRWQDKFGVGRLKLEFDKDSHSFAGTWTADSGSGRTWEWNGKR